VLVRLMPAVESMMSRSQPGLLPRGAAINWVAAATNFLDAFDRHFLPLSISLVEHNVHTGATESRLKEVSDCYLASTAA
jgi:hypothetical protein